MQPPDKFILTSGVTLGIVAYVFHSVHDAIVISCRKRGNRALELKDAIKTIRVSVLNHRPLTEDEKKALELVLNEAEYRTPHTTVVRNGNEVCPDCKCSLNFKNLKYYCPKCGRYYTPNGR